ncbi:MAG: hypothetical protein ACRDPV_14445 [Gaiellaceae bacterium]
MTQADNSKLVRRFYEEAWGRGELGVIDELFAEDTSATTCGPGIRLPVRTGGARAEA